MAGMRYQNEKFWEVLIDAKTRLLNNAVP